MKYLYLLLSSILFLMCSDPTEDEPILQEGDSVSVDESMYFPPGTSSDWSTKGPEDLGWNTAAVNDLISYLEASNTRAFIILKDGKIVMEEYFGTNVRGTAPFNSSSQWYWASAGKALTATLTGIAHQEGVLNIDDPVSDYLGEGWTSLSPEKEGLITLKHQLTMTTGLDYEISDLDCTLPSCLEYKTDAGNQWYYHNGPYTLLEKVVENASGTDYNQYTHEKISSIIGMNGQWISQGYNNVYWSTARDMARFGLLILNEGQWDGTPIITDASYFKAMTSISQDLNPSYGYLCWLNGSNSIIFPGFEDLFNISLSEAAPDDLFAGMGKNGQFVAIIPSINMVVVRMGEAPDGSLVPITFHNEMWERINLVLD